MRRYFVQERGKKRRHSRATASIFNEVIGQKNEQIQAIYFVTTPKLFSLFITGDSLKKDQSFCCERNRRFYCSC